MSMPALPALEDFSPAAQARHLMRGARTATLGTLLGPDDPMSGAPFASLVLSATHPDARPILLLSRLAAHTRNLAQDPRAALLYENTAGLQNPLMGARLSLLGAIEPTPASEIPLDRSRFLARHPGAADYADFADFSFYRLTPQRALLVGGFGRIEWLEGADLRLPKEQWEELSLAEAGILSHMNADHKDAILHYAHTLLGEAKGGWRMAGFDPEGCDLALAGRFARLAFTEPVRTAEAARATLVRLARLQLNN